MAEHVYLYPYCILILSKKSTFFQSYFKCDHIPYCSNIISVKCFMLFIEQCSSENKKKKKEERKKAGQAHSNHMYFKAKSKILHLGQGNFKHKYKLGGEWLEGSPEENNLGVLVDERTT